MERRTSESMFDRILHEEVRKLNQHLPKQRKLLTELLSEESPEVTSLDGRTIIMRSEELELLASLIPKEAESKLLLPIVLIRRNDMGPGAFAVLSGEKLEMYAVSRLLETFSGTLEDFLRDSTSELVVYKPQVSELIRRTHSLFVIGFGVQEGFRP